MDLEYRFVELSLDGRVLEILSSEDEFQVVDNGEVDVIEVLNQGSSFTEFEEGNSFLGSFIE